MNGLKSTDEVVECPLCMEPLEVDDLNFFPCTCGYQICRFCWHRIRTDENELCPACRKEYPENPADFTPLTQEEMIAFKSQKRQRDQQRKQKVTENRKHLANVRVVQKNLVFVVGLPPRLADADILKKHEYFGKYGKIHKVVINPSTTYAGVQGPSASAYVTYVHNSDALRAIQSVNNIMIDGRLIKTSLGTTKYCSHFMKNQQCPKGDCMYLHELGDSEASFTKEEMHQGKHQEYEKRLHDSLIAASGSIGNSGSCSNTGSIGIGSFSTCTANNSKNAECNKTANSCSSTALPLVIQTPSSSSSSPSTNVTPLSVAPQQRDAWPSLAISPVNFKEAACGGQANVRNKKDKSKNDKSRSERGSKNTRNNSSQYVPSINKDNSYSHSQGGKERNAGAVLSSELPANASFLETRSDFNKSNRPKTEKQKEKSATSRNTRQIQKQREKRDISSEDELSLLHDSEKCIANDILEHHIVISTETENSHNFDPTASKAENHRSISSSSNISSSSDTNGSNSSICRNSGVTPALSDSTSGKSSPNNFPELFSNSKEDVEEKSTVTSFDNSCSGSDAFNVSNIESKPQIIGLKFDNNEERCNDIDIGGCKEESLLTCTESALQLSQVNGRDDAIIAIDLSKMNLFDDSNSFFSSAAMFQPTGSLKPQTASDLRQNHINGAVPHLPDLLNGIDGYLNNKIKSNDLQTIHNYHENQEYNRRSQPSLIQLQQLPQQHASHIEDHTMGRNIFGTNMLKFFDFHKNQQQQQINQQFQIHGQTLLNENVQLSSLAENSRVNNFQSSDLSNGRYQYKGHLPKQRLFDSMPQQLQNQPTYQQPQQKYLQNCVTKESPQSASVDDDLGFDPFIETQKALAELMEHEVVEKQTSHLGNTKLSGSVPILHQPQQHRQIPEPILLDNSQQRTRMPPPGFNHMNAFGFGVPRVQNTSNMIPNIANIAGAGSLNGEQDIQQNVHQISHTWGMSNFQQPQHSVSDQQHIHQMNPNANYNKAGYSQNDWTAMDPAILSLRQFSAFPLSPQTSHHSAEIFMPNLPHQQQNGQGFSTQPLHQGNVNLANAALNSPQTSQAQVNANVQGMLEFLKTRQFV